VRSVLGDGPIIWRGFLVTILTWVWLVAVAQHGIMAQQGDDSSSQDTSSRYWEDRLERLRSVPYVDFSPDSSGEQQGGIMRLVRPEAWPGYNFYCSRSDGRIFLLDMDGHAVHQWAYHPKKGSGSDYAVLLPNGDLLVIKKHRALLRLDWNSRMIWEKRMRPHHDLTVTSEGNIYVIVRDWESHRGMRVWFDAILLLTPDGQEIDRWYTYDHLDDLKNALDTDSFLDTVLDSALGGGPEKGPAATMAKTEVADHRYDFDYFHLNTVSLIPDNPLGLRDARFRPGNLLICLRNVNQIVILERETYRILWSWGQGDLEWPHHPSLLPNGHVLVFDNGIHRRYSRVLEIDPRRKTIIWEYRADPSEDFFSPRRGAAQRLPNGNTLITESDRGRVFEVTPEGNIVWTWLNPIQKNGRRQTVYRMLRLPGDLIEPLRGEPSTVEPLRGNWWWWR
jgi:hypothetical protein